MIKKFYKRYSKSALAALEITREPLTLSKKSFTFIFGTKHYLTYLRKSAKYSTGFTFFRFVSRYTNSGNCHMHYNFINLP